MKGPRKCVWSRPEVVRVTEERKSTSQDVQPRRRRSSATPVSFRGILAAVKAMSGYADTLRRLRIEALRESILQGRYEVDAFTVASSIVEAGRVVGASAKLNREPCWGVGTRRSAPGKDVQAGGDMDVRVSGKNIQVPRRLQDYATTRLTRIGRILDDLKTCAVVFTEIDRAAVSASYVVEVTAKTGHGRMVRAEVQAPDPYAALDRAAEKLESQVRRMKGRMLARNRGSKGGQQRASEMPPDTDSQSEADNGIRISRLKRFELKPLLPEEAAEELELLGHNFYFFTNKESGLPAVVYRRRYGDFGLIEPAEA